MMQPTICSKKKGIPSFLLSNIFFIFIVIYVGLQGIAQASLMVTPTRIVFEGRVRTQEVNLLHRGEKETTYRISFQHMRMKPDGSYEEIQEPKPIKVKTSTPAPEEPPTIIEQLPTDEEIKAEYIHGLVYNNPH